MTKAVAMQAVNSMIYVYYNDMGSPKGQYAPLAMKGQKAPYKTPCQLVNSTPSSTGLCYFKAGTYNQAGTTTSAGIGQMAKSFIQSLTVVHT